MARAARATGMTRARATAHVTEAVELGDVEFTVAVVVRQPELLLAVGFLASSLVTPQSADSIVLCAKGHVGEVLAVFKVKVIALVAVWAVVA